jgi:tetratricopeptide (TPR) repeat protein
LSQLREDTVPQQPKPASESGRPAAERQFVDREEPIALFQAALKAPQPTKPLVLVFHGGAGTGKSRLRRELVRLVDSRQQPVDRRQETADRVVTATLDFDLPANRQPDAALFFLRSALRDAYEVRFPSFDLAYAVLWQKNHPDAPLGDDLKPLLESGSLLPQLLDDTGKLPLIGLVPRIANILRDQGTEGARDRVPETPTSYLLPTSYYATWWRERGERELEDLPQMEPAAIVEQLPKLWAADLKDELQHGSRESRVENSEAGDHSPLSTPHSRSAVLFVDSYEKLWGTGDEGRRTKDEGQKTDAWVQELVKQLPEVLWVMSGRQKLRWEEVEKEWGDALSQHELGALPEHSAREFLSSCGITDEPIQYAIAKGSQGLPHYLNLAVDTFLEIKQAGQRAGSVQSLFSGAESSDSPEQLFVQFIRHLDQPEIETLQVLSASRFWNYGLFEHLVTEYQTGYPLTAYDDLSRFSFVGEGAAPETRTMHDLMREALQEHQAPELRKRVHLFLHEYYARQLEGLDVKGITDKHKAALTEAFYHGQQAKSAAELWTWFKAALDVFDDAGQHRLLVSLLREVVVSLEAGFSHAHPSVAESLLDLARQIDANGEYVEAEPLYRRALGMLEEGRGPEDALVADCLSALAELLRKRGRFEDAEATCRRVVELRNRLGGPATDQAEALDNLAVVLYELNKHAEAEELLRRAIALSEREVGPEHRKTGLKLNNLASIVLAQKRHGEAESLFRRALAIFEKTVGVNHPDLVLPLDGLANTLNGLGRYGEAEPLLRRSLKLCEENLGPEHPDTAICMNNLGSVLQQQGRYAEAEPLLRAAVAAYEKKVGLRHTNAVAMMHRLVLILTRQGKSAEAETVILGAIAAREKEFGPEHPQTADVLHWAGGKYRDQKRYAEAERLYRRALAIREKVFGTDHPFTAETLEGLAKVCEQTGRTAEAQEFSARAQRIRAQAAGEKPVDSRQGSGRIQGQEVRTDNPQQQA